MKHKAYPFLPCERVKLSFLDPCDTHDTVTISIYSVVLTRVWYISTIRSSLMRRRSISVVMFLHHLTVFVILSSLHTTQAASFYTTLEPKSALTSGQSQGTNGSAVDQGYTQRDGYRSVAYYVVSSAASISQTGRSVDVHSELGNIWPQAQFTRYTSREADSRFVRVRQHTSRNRRGALDRS